MVRALLVGVTFAQGCSVCGDGYQVGSPSAITSWRSPKLPDTPFACNDLELAGLQGSIPIEACYALPLSIFKTCACKESATRNTNEYTNSRHGSGSSSLRRVQNLNSSSTPVTLPPVSAPGHATPVFSPVAAASFDPISNGHLPTPTSYSFPGPAAPTTAGPTPETIVGISLGLFAIVVFISIVGCISRQCATRSPPTAQRLQAPVTRREIEETPTILRTIPVTTTTLLEDEALARRPLVLAVLFPNEGKPEGDGTGRISGRSLKYDQQSKHYTFCEDTPEAPTCSICLEVFVSEDNCVTGLCSHVYHRDCILNWLQCGHNDCPNCRQLMWDPETYKMVDQCIKDQKRSNQSAPFDDIMALT